MKILLLGSNLNYNPHLFTKNGLEALGVDVTFIGYNEKEKISPWFRIALEKSYLFRKIFAKNKIKRYAKEIIEKVKQFEPDILLTIKGSMIEGKTIEYLGKEFGVKTVLWFPDDPRYFHSLVKHIAPFYDYVFTKSEVMIPKYKEYNSKRVYVLPFCCDPQIHKPIEGLQKTIDVSFIGAFNFNRLKIVKSIRGKKLHVYGPYWRILIRKEWIHNPIWGPEFTNTINRSKIGLNIHVTSDLDIAPNARTFEIPACKTLMLTDKPRDIEKFFTIGKEVICYSSLRDLNELIDYYLDMTEERDKISERAYERSKDHTYEKRMEYLISKIK